MNDLTIRDFVRDVRATAEEKGFHDAGRRATLPDDGAVLIRLAEFTLAVGRLLDEQRKTGEIPVQRVTAVIEAVSAAFIGKNYPLRPASLPFVLPDAAAAHTVRQLLHLAIEASEALGGYIASDCTALDWEELSDGFIVGGDLAGDDPDAFLAALTKKTAKNRARPHGYGRHDTKETPQMHEQPTPSANAPADPLPPIGERDEEPLTKVFASTPLSSRRKRGGNPPTPLAEGKEASAV
jgi:hypothetical protein